MATRPGRVLAVVVAHPDDDVMAAAGLVALHRDDPELRVVLVHATDGEAGEIAPGSGATRASLAAVRRREDRAGWDVIGRQPDRHEWFGLPDGGLADLPAGELAARVADVFAEERPDVVMTFGPDGITGHLDHIAIGAAATTAFLQFAGRPGPGFRRLLHGAFPQSALDRVNARRIAAGQEPIDSTQMYQVRGVPDDDIACSIDQRSVLPQIMEAFRAHRSQWAPPWSEYVERGWRSAAGFAHLVQAWPAREVGAPRMADPFEGL